MLLLQVIQEMHEAEESPGGNKNARLHNVSASLGTICALLCAVSVYGLSGHRTDIMSQVDSEVVAWAIQLVKAHG